MYTTNTNSQKSNLEGAFVLLKDSHCIMLIVNTIMSSRSTTKCSHGYIYIYALMSFLLPPFLQPNTMFSPSFKIAAKCQKCSCIYIQLFYAKSTLYI
jgi:hypothetical protein